MAWFVGNVLSPTETQPEQEDHTFAFTRKEAEGLDLQDIPIRMEHYDNMQVGSIKQAWTGADGSKWVVGKLDDSSYMGSFAKHAIQEDSSGTKYYTGLSLQHVHTEYPDGSSNKRAIEVSLCVDPRRPDCKIAFVSENETNSLPYKLAHIASKMSAAEEVKPTEPMEVETKEDAPAEKEITDPKMMQVIVEQQKEMEALQKQANELQELKKKMAEEKEKQLAQDRAKSEAMANALIEAWGKTLNETDLTDQTQASMKKIAKEFPKESQEFFRVAHQASKKYAEKEKELKKAMEDSKNVELKENFKKVMTSHAASRKTAEVKQEKKSDKQHFMDAIRKYRVEGTGRDLMEEVLEIGQKRRRTY